MKPTARDRTTAEITATAIYLLLKLTTATCCEYPSPERVFWFALHLSCPNTAPARFAALRQLHECRLGPQVSAPQGAVGGGVPSRHMPNHSVFTVEQLTGR